MKNSASDGVLTLGNNYAKTRNNIIYDIENKTLHAHKYIGGIPCPDEDSTQEMLAFFTKENVEIMQIKDELTKKALPFKAIIPTEFYEKVKKEKEVYTFKRIDDHSFVPVSRTSIEAFVKNVYNSFSKKLAVVTTVVQIILGIIIVAIGESILYWWNGYYFGHTNFFLTYACWWTPLCFSWLSPVIAYNLKNEISSFLRKTIITTNVLCDKVVKMLSKETYKTFWPNLTDNFMSGMPEVKIIFIKPPSHIVESNLIWKKAGYDIHISAETKAFSLDIQPIKHFVEGTIQGFLKEDEIAKEIELQKKIEAQRAFWEKWTNEFDPIISSEIGKYTVLIDAYGGKSFISEKEVVDSVMNYYNGKLEVFQTALN